MVIDAQPIVRQGVREVLGRRYEVEEAENGDSALELLTSIGLSDRNGDGMLEDASGAPVRFSILTQAGHTARERQTAMLQEHLRKVGIAVDVGYGLTEAEPLVSMGLSTECPPGSVGRPKVS